MITIKCNLILIKDKRAFYSKRLFKNSKRDPSKKLAIHQHDCYLNTIKHIFLMRL